MLADAAAQEQAAARYAEVAPCEPWLGDGGGIGPVVSRLGIEAMLESDRNPLPRERLAAFLRVFREAVAELARAAQASGSAPAGVSPGAIATLVGAIGDGLFLLARLGPDLDPAGALKALRALLTGSTRRGPRRDQRDDGRILDSGASPAAQPFDTAEHRFAVHDPGAGRTWTASAARCLVTVAISRRTPDGFLNCEHFASRLHGHRLPGEGPVTPAPYAREQIREVGEDRSSAVPEPVLDGRIRCRRIASRQDG